MYAGGILGLITAKYWTAADEKTVIISNCLNFGVLSGINIGVNVRCILGGVRSHYSDAGIIPFSIINCHYDKQMCGGE
jgi:hypothetical protein